MKRIFVAGAGRMGALISFLLSSSGDYCVILADKIAEPPALQRLANLTNIEYVCMDMANESCLNDFLTQQSVDAIISSLPFYCNVLLANLASKNMIPYFDLTEDVATTQHIIELSKKNKNIFVPQCGLAPGLISIIGAHLMRHFHVLDTVKLRVGALPVNVSNALQYSLNWSTDGLINEYANPCAAIDNQENIFLRPLEGLEQIKIDGLTYEAFNTSGGIGSLVETYAGKVQQLNYKTIRYPGHCEKIKFLMEDLKLKNDRPTLKRIFEQVIPKTAQDVVLVYASVTGMQEQQFVEEHYVKKFYPQKIGGYGWSAIQLSTASCLCAVMDLVLQHVEQYQGFIRQEAFLLEEIISNRFGAYYG